MAETVPTPDDDSRPNDLGPYTLVLEIRTGTEAFIITMPTLREADADAIGQSFPAIVTIKGASQNPVEVAAMCAAEVTLLEAERAAKSGGIH